MIADLLTPGASITLFTSDGQQLSAHILDSNAVGVLVTARVPAHGGSVEQQRFFPWTSVSFITA